MDAHNDREEHKHHGDDNNRKLSQQKKKTAKHEHSVHVTLTIHVNEETTVRPTHIC